MKYPGYVNSYRQSGSAVARSRGKGVEEVRCVWGFLWGWLLKKAWELELVVAESFESAKRQRITLGFRMTTFMLGEFIFTF